MLFKALRSIIHAATGKQCPRCGSTNTDEENGIWYCYECEKEFG
jgi:ribosomal protein L37AE/L43A